MRAIFAALFLVAASEEVVLQTADGTLHGTLLHPDSGSPVPVVLIIAGSGPTDRDGNSAGLTGRNDSLKQLAESLAAEGIASLRYDKRGVAASSAVGPAEIDLRFETYVGDAAGWGEQLLADSRFSSLTIIGHSEGALIASLAAQRMAVRSVVSLAGAGRPVADVIIEQLERQLTGTLLERSREIIAELKAGNTVANVPISLYPLFRPTVQPYLISLFRYDPAQEIGRLIVPVLIAQGTSDIQVSVTDAMLLAGAAQRDSVAMIVGMNHVLKNVGDDPAAQNRSYIDPSIPIDSRLVKAIALFIEPALRRRAVAR